MSIYDLDSGATTTHQISILYSVDGKPMARVPINDTFENFDCKHKNKIHSRRTFSE